MSRAKWATGVVLATVLVSTGVAAPDDASAKNVQITLTVSKSAGGNAPKVVKMVGQEGQRSRMLVGWRLPIPMTTTPAEGGGKPVTNYIYQNVGVSAEITVARLGGGRISLDGNIEISGARETTGDKQPIIGTFQQAVKVITLEGKKLRIAEGPDPEGGTVALDIEASVLP